MGIRPAEEALVEKTTLEPLSPGEELRVWRPVNLAGVELMTAVNSNRLWRVFHETYAICVIPPENNCPVGSELVDWWYRGQEHVMRSGSVALMEPGEIHANKRNHRAASFFVFFVDPAIFRSAAEELSVNARTQLLAQTESRALRTALCRLYAALADGAAPLEQETRLATCIRVVLETAGWQRPAAPPRAHLGVTRVRDYLHEHLARTVHLGELAALSGMSRYHLAHTFARTYGLAPHAYQNQVRLAFVRNELRRGARLSDIDAGFFDQSHLIKHFKHAMGVTPKRFASPLAGVLPRFGGRA